MRHPRARTFAAFLAVLVLAYPAPAGAGEPPSPCLLVPVQGTVTDPFRAPGCPWCPGNRGLEYAVAPGQAVRAGAAGTVSFAGSVAGIRYVVVEHSSGLRTTYGRLGSTAVVVGQVVTAGAVVGATGDGLFFGVRRGDVYLDPAGYLVRSLHRPRLVPTFGGPRRPARSAGLTCTAARSRR